LFKIDGAMKSSNAMRKIPRQNHLELTYTTYLHLQNTFQIYPEDGGNISSERLEPT
jgi:hypothetical protein